MSGHKKWSEVRPHFQDWETNEPTIEELKAIQRQLGKTDTHLIWYGRKRFVIAHTDKEREAYKALTFDLLECGIHVQTDLHGPQGRYGYYWHTNSFIVPVPAQEIFQAVLGMRTPGCDADETPMYVNTGLDGASSVICRCVVCAHCGKHTGNSNQGHYWAYCKVTKTKRDFHFCCPDNCELENNVRAE